MLLLPDQKNQKKYSKSTFACVNCKIKKVKCFGEPQCIQCMKKGISCVFVRQHKRGPKPSTKKPVSIFASELIKDLNPTNPICSLLNDLQKQEQLLIQELNDIRTLANVVKTEDFASSLTQDTKDVLNDSVIYINFPEQLNSLEYGNSHSALLPETSILDHNSSQTNISDSSTNFYPSTSFQETNNVDSNTYPSSLLEETNIIDHHPSQTNSSNSSANISDSGVPFKKFICETSESMRAKINSKAKIRRSRSLTLDLGKKSQSLKYIRSNTMSNNSLKMQQTEPKEHPYFFTQISDEPNELFTNNFMEYMNQFPFCLNNTQIEQPFQAINTNHNDLCNPLNNIDIIHLYS
ncbi:29988_t:CDS:1 [Racocetra persica]|uniref:29988_t:CDS:1 n=1 Tax=Racocetra persica TaxID=160502 RepID=A0ACA9KLE2_9GLOM|nr:29988_t:CDS:1 [Racocetra persica]